MADSQVQLTSAHEADKVDGEQLAGRIASLSVGQETPAEQVPRRRQAEPQYDQRRVDPFLFGSRYLQDEDDVFEFNAWDHVETDDAHKEYAEKQYELQRQSPVSDFERRECCHSSPLVPDLSSF
jgi:tRNAThr (cytosine32-N3)-methyltransferase